MKTYNWLERFILTAIVVLIVSVWVNGSRVTNHGSPVAPGRVATGAEAASGMLCNDEVGVPGQLGYTLRSWRPRSDGRCYAEDAMPAPSAKYLQSLQPRPQ